MLADLAARGWIEEARTRAAAEDPRRISYALTREGRRVLSVEAARLASLARLARARLDTGRSS
ncbi:hypothetical protein D3C83_330180 [compost metagenome]